MATNDELWARMLYGEHPVARLEARINRMVPSNPRCKICFAPFAGAGGTLYNLFGRKPSTKNPTMCNVCQVYAEKHPGGAEVELSFLFADVRGSTSMAEGMSPTEFNAVLNHFFHTATNVLIDQAAWVDKFVGDEIVVFFFPNAVPNKHHARVAIESARELLRATEHDHVPIGIGVHTGKAFVGTVGGAAITDVTAVGDDVNVAARLASAAKAGSIVASEAACTASGLSFDDSHRQSLDLKGKSTGVAVRILTL